MRRARQAPYTLRPWAMVAYFVLFIPGAAIAVASTNPDMRVLGIDAVLPEFYTHTTNLLLSLMGVLGYGFFRLLYGATIRELAIVTGVMIGANYAYELFLTLWNTRDIIDAHYGLAGSLLAFAYLTSVKLWGLRRTGPEQA